MTLAAIVCCVMISTVFTSCSKDEEGTDYYYYRANGQLDSSNAGFSSLFMISDYTEAIESVVGNQLTKKDDQRVIQACDAVYATHQTKYGTKVTGSVQIYRYKVGEENNRQVIKEYTY